MDDLPGGVDQVVLPSLVDVDETVRGYDASASSVATPPAGSVLADTGSAGIAPQRSGLAGD